MKMGKKTKTPAAPDYTGLANQQAALGKESWNAALQANRPNQQNQFGNLSWSQDPTTGQWTQTSALNQPQQDIFNQQQANQQQIANMTGGMLGGFNTSPIDFSGAPGLPSVTDYSSLGEIPGAVDYSSLGNIPQVGQYSQQATDLYNQLAEPGLANAENAQRARAAAMGLPEFGSRAGTTMNQQLADARSRSGMMGAQAGIAQGNTMFGQGMQAYQQGAQNLNNQFTQGMAGRQQGVSELNNQFNQGMGLNQQGIQNILQQRGANLAQMQGLMGLGQSVGQPQFNQFGQTGAYNTPDLMGAAQGNYNAQMDKTNAKNADKSNTMSTVGTVAGIAAVAF
jgi:hypothetical protein